MNEFDVILDKDEQIVKTYSPNKKRMVTLGILPFLFPALFGLIFVVIGVLGLCDVIHFTDIGHTDPSSPIVFIVMGIMFSTWILIMPFILRVKYNKTKYAVTNKRILIRHGIIGVDYKALNIESILSVEVKVNFLDKLIQPNTGSIIFGSAVSFATKTSGTAGLFVFDNIEDPYNTYKEIKEIVEQYKK